MIVRFRKRFIRIAALSVLSLIVVASAVSCSKVAKKESSPDISMAESSRFQYAVYMLPAPKTQNPTVLLQKAIAKYPDLKLVEELPKESQGMLLHAYLNMNIQDSYAPPGLESLQYSGRGL